MPERRLPRRRHRFKTSAVDAVAPACDDPWMIAGRDHRGWYRPRSLAHFDTPERPQLVTFRAADSLPAAVAQARSGEGPAVYRRRIEAALDAGAGACLLSRPELARIVREGLIHCCGRTHDMHAFVVMPNHVHVLTTFRQGCRLSDVVRGWKSYSARRINAILGCEGAFWQRDYFDRYIRDETRTSARLCRKQPHHGRTDE
jgi:REP element-mobilizing transposase RayT